MGRVILGYTVFILALFLALTVTASVKVALWIFAVLHVSCALGASVCLWWEQKALRFTRPEREEMATYRGYDVVTEQNKDALLQGDVAGLRR